MVLRMTTTRFSQTDGSHIHSIARKTISFNSVLKSSQDTINPLPQTSPERLTTRAEKTILYLAYGSNLSKETFIGNRGIQPLSAINVHVPTLDLTFDLAGIAYNEPCFANSAYRIPDASPTLNSGGGWHKGMIGVVYEVTPEDYRTIIATEGGGASYKDVVVDCYALRPTNSVGPPQGIPFAAHTLLSPGGAVSRPDPSYAQPSARYLKLITDGGDEHGLPAEYMAYLYSLQPYTITSYRQTAGKTLFVALWMPVIMFMFALGNMMADADGRLPPWFARVYAWVFRACWASYDLAFKWVFGDGERTIQGGGEFKWVDVKEERWWYDRKGIELEK